MTYSREDQLSFPTKIQRLSDIGCWRQADFIFQPKCSLLYFFLENFYFDFTTFEIQILYFFLHYFCVGP